MNSNFKQQAPLANQAQMLANKGRYGDSMLVHMNPLEVDVLKSMTPNNQLTVNPDTGQPEAFLPILLGLAGALAGGTATTGVLATLGAVGAGAIGSGIGTAIQTGSLEEGLKAGLISGLVGGVGGQLMEGLAGATGASATGSAAGATGGSTAANLSSQTVIDQALATAANPLTVAPSVAPGSIAALSGPTTIGTTTLAAPVVQQTAPVLADQAIKQSIGQRLSSGFADVLASPNLAESALAGASTGLTGQALTDDFNLRNMGGAPLQSDEDAEDFYVPVNADDRGVQFNNMNAGSSEYDYFSNPFSFTQELGLIRTFQEGGGLGIASGAAGSDLDMYNPDSPNFDLSAFPQTYGSQKFNIPSYMTDPFGTGSSNLTPDGSYYGSVTPESIRAGISVRGPDGVARGGRGFAQPFQYRPAYAAPESLGGAASTQASNTDQVGNDLDDMIQDSFTRQVYDPRTSGPLAGIRGASDIDNIDYNQRLLGDATKEISFMRPMNEAELTARNDALAAEQAAADAAARNAEAAARNAARSELGQQFGSFMLRSPANQNYDPSYVLNNDFGESVDFGLDMPANDFSYPYGGMSNEASANALNGLIGGNALYPGDPGYEEALAAAGPSSGGIFGGSKRNSFTDFGENITSNPAGAGNFAFGSLNKPAQEYNPQDYFNFGNIGLGGGM